MNNTPTLPAFMSVQDVAAHFGCGVSTVWRWAKTGVISKPVKIGGTTRWRTADIQAAFATSQAV